MRPPDLPGGNQGTQAAGPHPKGRFNEAAGFTRRKLRPVLYITGAIQQLQ